MGRSKLVFGLLMIVSFVYTPTKAQRRHAIYAELFGNGILNSINYDVRFKPASNGLGLRIGAGSTYGGSETDLYFPTHINYVIGQRHALEVGAGVINIVSIRTPTNQHYIYPSAALQYRFQGKHGLLFRGGVAPTFPTNGKEARHLPSYLFWLWPGVSLGYAF